VWRDAHATGSHLRRVWDAIGTMYGQHAPSLKLKGQS
jgi:hypothetical protein